MPLLIHALGKEPFFEIVEGARPATLLEPAVEAWKESTKHITAWADREIEQFVQRKLANQQRKKRKGTQPAIVPQTPLPVEKAKTRFHSTIKLNPSQVVKPVQTIAAEVCQVSDNLDSSIR